MRTAKEIQRRESRLCEVDPPAGRATSKSCLLLVGALLWAAACGSNDDVLGADAAVDSGARDSGSEIDERDAESPRDSGTGSDAGRDGAVPGTAAPRPIAPLSTSSVTSHRPTLRWELAGGTEGARLELCRDRAMTTGCLPVLEATGDRARPVEPLEPGWWFWRLRRASADPVGDDVGPVWQFQVGARSADLDVDTHWGTVLDVNGDGYTDVVVGSPDASPGSVMRAGMAQVFLGSDTGISTTPTAVLEGTTMGERLGTAVGSAGDIDGDGFADVIIASRGGLGGGILRVYRGSAEGLSTTPAFEFAGTEVNEFFDAAASAGDVNGDGYADILVGASLAGDRIGAARVFFGSADGLSSSSSQLFWGSGPDAFFGVSVAGAGDVDGDGYGDVIVGASGESSGAGSAAVYLGAAAGLPAEPTLVLGGEAPNELFGQSVACAGDLNGDGYADVVVGADNARPGGRAGAGAARVFLGASAGLTATPAFEVTGAAPQERLGSSVAGAGDVDGDGYADFLVGARWASPGDRTRAGVARIYRGAAETGHSSAPAIVLEGREPEDTFGSAVASAGDVDGDGYADVIVGAPRATPGAVEEAGSASIFPGASAGTSTTPSVVLEGSHAEEKFGEAVGGGSG